MSDVMIGKARRVVLMKDARTLAKPLKIYALPGHGIVGRQRNPIEQSSIS